jgi:hypothetical protein
MKIKNREIMINQYKIANSIKSYKSSKRPKNNPNKNKHN